MIYKKDFIYIIYWVNHMTDGVTVDIIWIQGTRMPWFDTRLGHLKKKYTSDICSIYLISYIYIEYIFMYIIYLIYNIYM